VDFENEERCRIDFSKMEENTEIRTRRIRRKVVDSTLPNVSRFFIYNFVGLLFFYSRHGNLQIKIVNELNYYLHQQNIKV
jgi:hypothetical protein